MDYDDDVTVVNTDIHFIRQILPDLQTVEDEIDLRIIYLLYVSLGTVTFTENIDS